MKKPVTRFKTAFSLAALLIAAMFLCSITPAQVQGDRRSSVRFVQITDVHLNPGRVNSGGRMLKHSLELLDDAVAQINEMSGVDFVVFTGDMIDGPDKKLLAEFARAANKLNVPWYWTTGNHDIGPGGLNRKTFLAAMNAGNPYIKPEKTCYAFTAGGFLFAAMDGAYDDRITAQGLFSRECLGFLDQMLSENSDMPAVIFQHFPLVYPFSSLSHGVKNQREYLELINAHSNVKAVFSGHFHVAKIQQKDNVLHVSTPALVQYPNAFRVVTMESTDQGVIIDIRLVETRLGNVQAQSKKNSSSAALSLGKESDRNARVVIR